MTPTVSIVVPCRGRLEHTRECLRALPHASSIPFELIAVDDGSPDATPAYLRGYADAAPFPVRVIANAEGRGLAAACNQGLAAARGEYLVLLDDDAIATDAWLDQLIALADSAPDIGMAGPMINDALPPQLVRDAAYADLAAMHAFARDWRERHRGQWLEAEKLSGTCLLIKRKVYEAIGGLDERLGPGLFDGDYCLRARKAGFRLAVAHDLFVHHGGNPTLAPRALGPELARREARAMAQPAAIPPRPKPAPYRPQPAQQGAAGPRRMKVSLTMIVRDEEHNLPDCLRSAEGLFDEVVVVDTGSKDATRAVAESLGAKVFDFTWIDDFAAARNCALGHATGDYAFWLDADDRVEPDQYPKLKALLDGLRDAGTAYVLQCACDPGPEGLSPTVVDHVRLFPLREDARWSYRVHEQILPSLRRAGVDVAWSDVVIRHVGYADPALRSRKLERDQRILTADLGDKPGDPFILFNLGGVAHERGRHAEALEYFRRSLAGSAPTDSITRKLHALIARCHQELGRPGEALAACDAGLAADPEDAELWFRRAVILRETGRPGESEAAFRRVLSADRPDGFRSQDEGIYGHLTLRNLARLAEERGARDEAADLWGRVLVECPGDPEAIREGWAAGDTLNAQAPCWLEMDARP
jgi:glycosyltransferase involved in cell wall biosynthesis